jgi:hypothetical protein
MDIELTNEAATLIGQYVKGGKEKVLAVLMERGGIIRKEIKPSDIIDRNPGFERVLYYYSGSDDYTCYDPVRVKRAKERQATK